MAICRFFLNGTCKYGSRCRNEHVKEEQMGRPQEQAAQIEGAAERAVQDDLEYPPAWPFSCYGNPGSFDTLLTGCDYSLEEVMLEALKMKKCGQYQLHLQNIQQLTGETSRKRSEKLLFVTNKSKPAAGSAGTSSGRAFSSASSSRPFMNNPFQLAPNSAYPNASTNGRAGDALPQNQSQFGNSSIAPSPASRAMFPNIFQQTASVSAVGNYHKEANAGYTGIMASAAEDFDHPLSGKLAPLSDGDKLAYESDNFTIWRVPERPPP